MEFYWQALKEKRDRVRVRVKEYFIWKYLQLLYF
jgi:hypothetical protein